MSEYSNSNSQSIGIKAGFKDTSSQLTYYFIPLISYTKQLHDSSRNPTTIKTNDKAKKMYQVTRCQIGNINGEKMLRGRCLLYSKSLLKIAQKKNLGWLALRISPSRSKSGGPLGISHSLRL